MILIPGTGTIIAGLRGIWNTRKTILLLDEKQITEFYLVELYF